MEKKIFTVASLNEEIKLLLEGDFNFSSILVQGEVTSLNKHYTGHYYFKLKDKDGSILSCVMFKSYTPFAYEDLKNGDEVICLGSINVYEKGGTYSLVVRKIQQEGLGKYLQELKKLELKLQSEGYFDIEKKPIPYLPNKVALITSLKGAAICDVVSTINARLKTNIYIFPCAVQGEGASKTIINALESSYKIEPDVIIITRGGGSKEDLYCFNDEELVKKVAISPYPIISAVGHSIDTSLIDKVSTIVAITPTDAATKCILTKEEYSLRITNSLNRLNNVIRHKLDNLQFKLSSLASYIDLKNLKKNNELYLQNVYHFSLILDNSINERLINEKNHLFDLKNYFIKTKDLISPYKELLNKYNHDLNINISNRMQKIYTDYQVQVNKLEALNPLKTMMKGYSILYKDNKLIDTVNNINKGDLLTIKLNDGIIKTKVIEKENH